MNQRLSRQSFLGNEQAEKFGRAKIGLVGLCGGGSHINQQLAHIGFLNVTGVDKDIVDTSNLNRLVGATASDVDRTPKVDVAERVARAVNPDSKFVKKQMLWQECADELRDCAVILGCVDSFKERDELERFCRRFLIQYVDIGMGVVKLGDGFMMSGQVVLSTPGRPCMWCMGLLTESRLAEEAQRYGDAGDQPQVVWANGQLASAAIGILVQLITPWHPRHEDTVYLEYNGRSNTIVADYKQQVVRGLTCVHHGDAPGDPFFT